MITIFLRRESWGGIVYNIAIQAQDVDESCSVEIKAVFGLDISAMTNLRGDLWPWKATKMRALCISLDEVDDDVVV